MAGPSFLAFACILYLALTTRCDVSWITGETPGSYQDGNYGGKPHQVYKSSDVVSPMFSVIAWNTSAMSTGPSMLFTNIDYNASYAYIFNSSDMSLVYMGPAERTIYNVRPQTYNGAQYLVYWQGELYGGGHAEGHCLMFDETYTLKYNLSTVGLSVEVDLHECQLTPHGTALITAYEPTQYDLSSVGGKTNDTLLDSVMQEIDVETNELRFEWRASWHFPVTASYSKYAEKQLGDSFGWDPYHINSLQKVICACDREKY